MKILAVPKLILLTVASIGCALSVAATSAPLPDSFIQFNDGSTTTPVVVDKSVFYTVGATIKGLKWQGVSNLVSPIATPYTTGGPLNAPAAGVLVDGRLYVFVTSTDGKVYKFDIANSILAGTFFVAKTNGINQIRDLRRSSSLSCATQDSPGPMSLVKSVDIGGDSPVDMLLVGTVDGCNSTTTNRVYAFDAQDVTTTPRWTFNAGGEYSVDVIQGCTVGDSLVICGTRLRNGAFQNTLWAIDLTSGQAVWATNAGNITGTPTFRPATADQGARVYVNAGTSVMAIDAATGAVIWQHNIGSTFRIVGAPAIGLDGTVDVTTNAGSVISLIDYGDSSADLWRTSFSTSTRILDVSAPTIDPDTGHIYVAVNDGYIHELQAETGRELSTRITDNRNASATPDSATPIQPAIDGQVGQRFITDFTATGGRRYPIPFTDTPPPDTTPPVITPSIAGSLVNKRWYNSDVLVSWSLSDPESPISATTGCDPSSVMTDTSGLLLTCSATSAGGTATQSVTIMRDATPPTVTYSGNAGSYAADQSVSITCSATDATSGISVSNCQSITGPAYSFNIGANSFSARASDNAGNNASASVTFTVTATTGSLMQLTSRFVVGSVRYQALSSRQRASVDGIVGLLNRALGSLQPGTKPIPKSVLIDAYKLGIAALGQSGFLSASQVALLDRIVGAL